MTTPKEPSGEIMRCEACNRVADSLEASLRRIWTDRCYACGGKLWPLELGLHITENRERVLPFSAAVESARSAFEEWISGPPYERDLYRWPMDEMNYAWPGQYSDNAVQLAWESWQQAQNQLPPAPPVG